MAARVDLRAGIHSADWFLITKGVGVGGEDTKAT